MILTPDRFTLIVKSLGLVQGFSKPSPSATALDGSSDPQSYAISPNTVDDLSLPVDDAQGPAKAFSAGFSPDLPTNDSLSAEDECRVDHYTSSVVAAQPFAPFDRTKAHIYRYRQQQSVNLGSWFVHEQWMTPSVFTCASGVKGSELDIASGWGSVGAARSILERHWDTFINETDFQYLSSIGINTVRLPVGYWSLGPVFCAGTPFEPVADVYRNAWPQVVRAINMAGDAGIGVLIDLHGAPGSQNGQPHSGISDGKANLFNVPADQDKAIGVLTFLVQQLSAVSNVVGIQMLNEPKNVPELTTFYTQAIEALRAVSAEAGDFPLYLHDGFDLNRFSDFVATRTDFVVQDYHSYYVFTPSDDAESAHDHTTDIEGPIGDSLAKAANHQRRNIVVDEWSCALTPQSLAQESDPEESRRQFCTGQMGVYTNATAGWSFWAYKKEECHSDPGWCFTGAVGLSLPASFFSYGQGPMRDPGQLQDVASIVAEMSVPSNDTDVLLSDTSVPFGLAAASPPPTLLGERGDQSFANVPDNASSEQNPQQRSAAKGYSDGYLTAKIFAVHDYSKLGFKGQYMADTIKAHGAAVIAPGSEESYRDAFMEGLRDGENVIRSVLLA